MPQHDDNEYSDTARALAARMNDEEPDPLRRQSQSRPPRWPRRQSTDRSAAGFSRREPHLIRRWIGQAEQTGNQLLRLWDRLSLLQRIGVVLLFAFLTVGTVLFLVYHQRLLDAIFPFLKGWRELPAGWLILWAMTFVVSFPPLVGYSTCVMLAGLVYGMKGWLVVSTASVVGSTCSFIASRTLLRSLVDRLTGNDRRFAALSLVLQHDGLKLLFMIRLCPLPYSISNGAISTIPTVTPLNFMLATAIASPKLLLHVFVGSRLAELAENGDKMDAKTKAASYAAIVIGVTAGILTGYFVYVRTKARAAELEADESGNTRRRTSDLGSDYIDDPDRSAGIDRSRGDDDISLHQTYEYDLEGGRRYQDDLSDDEYERERDVFDVGDGETDDELTYSHNGKANGGTRPHR